MNAQVSAAYINLLKSSLLNELYIESEAKLLYVMHAILHGLEITFDDLTPKNELIAQYVKVLLDGRTRGDYILFKQKLASGELQELHELRNFSEVAHTMVGKKRLDNILYCAGTVIEENIPGDFIETGIWKGGSCIFMRGILKAYGVEDRIVWAADSFEGVPEPSVPQDEGFRISRDVYPFLAVSLDDVKELFARYGLLDDRVVFLKGWFKDTLPIAPIEKLAVLRLDGDLYESTMDALIPLYNKVQPGGFVIVDDYNSCPPCKQAITDFRKKFDISDPLVEIDDQSVFWRKSK